MESGNNGSASTCTARSTIGKRYATTQALLGLSRQMVVVAYQYSGLVSSLITATSGGLLSMLTVAGVSYGRWLRFMAVPFALLFALAPAPIVVGVKLSIQ